MTKEGFAYLILRIGVAFAFLYPPVSALSSPESWIGYFPSFLFGYVSDEILLHAFGVVEVIIALWILSGKYIFWPSIAACAMLVGIVAFNIPNFEVLFRDLSIAAAAASLAVIAKTRQKAAPYSS